MDNFDDIVRNNDGASQVELELAGTGIRIGAFIIDHIIIVAFFVCPSIIFMFNHIQSDPAKAWSIFPVLMLMSFLVYFLKDIINGASLGKRVLGLTVRSNLDTSKVPSVPRLFLRNILTFVWPIEFLVLVCGAKKTKLGDQIAGTNVYRVSKKFPIANIIVSAILAMAILATSLFFIISSIFKNDDSYKMAVSYIEASPEVTDIVGNIEGYGYMPNGSLNYSGGYGQAFYSIKVIGSKNTAHVQIELEKKLNKDWEIVYFDYSK
ncbi:RDD family protein [Lacrimispora sp. 38-1]|uniref:RDD family protein n=1 Tax=Lacrimispora sp. 38-1 TaxID=3125778 RepID=UPI003CE93E84